MSPNITSKIWRLNNLYKIRDKEGTLITLKLNHSQSKTIKTYTHNRKLILKSRQQGISTLYIADNMDDCIFIAGFQAGIQSYGREESAKLQKRALLMWDELDPLIKHALGLTLVVKNSSGLEWSNGSILKIGNFRGDTLQSLHISELAKISRKYPDKAEELKTGAFQAVSTKSRLTIETTAEGQSGLFPEMWNEAIALQKAGIPLTALDFQPIFLSWFEDMDCNLYEHTPVTEGTKDYLVKLVVELGISVGFSSSLHGLTLIPHKTSTEVIEFTEFQINWLIVKLRQLGDKFNREYPATPDLAFSQSIEGTYFAVQLAYLQERGAIIAPVSLPTNVAVYTAWDLGMNDEMVITFWWLNEGIIYLIDEYHNTSQGFDHYIEILNKKPYTYIQHIMPHDINVREVGAISGRTRKDTLYTMGMTNIVVLPRISFLESIEIARNLLGANLQVFTTCKDTIIALQNYKKKFDTRIQAYLDTDVHDIHSNYMASFRYAAQGLSTHLTTKEAKKRENLHKKTYKGLAM